MKKVLAIVLAACMVFAFAACGEEKKTESNVIKVGVFEPQTGDNGAGGKQEILGIDYAHSLYPTVELGGKTYNIELVKVDNRTSAENGPSAAAELVNQGVAVVVGSYGSGVSMAGGTVFEEAGVAAIGTSCTNPQVTTGCKTYYRVCFTDPFQGPALAAYAYNTLGVKVAYSLGMNGSDYDLGLMHYFKEAFEKLGGTVIEEYFPEGTSNFVSYVNNAKANNAGVIMA
ncbi:MAG: ABC transporter substrate-binding protein, partial [Bacillota bacterium]|nr:ABC transporter substrate-binding protein [Bacillota bacterium]